jgi:hypothetical protein
MAQLGDASIADVTFQCEGKVQGMPYTLPGCMVNFVRFRLAEETEAAGHECYAALYEESTGVLVASSSARQDITTSPATYDFVFGDPVPAGDYVAVIMAGAGPGDLFVYGNYVGDGLIQGDFFTYPTPFDPATFGAAAVVYSQLIDFTEAGGLLRPSNSIGTGGMSDMNGGMQGRAARSRIAVPSNYFAHRNAARHPIGLRV